MRPSVWPSSSDRLAQAEPQNVHRRAEILDLEAGLLAHDRVPSVGADDEVRPDFEPSLRLLGGQPDDGGAVLEKAVDLGEHLEPERGIALGMLGEEIEEVPLRHQRNEMAVGGEMREVGEHDAVVADHACKLAHLLMRPLEERVEQPELVHDLQGRGMDGVAAKVAEEIGVLLQHEHIDAGAGEQESAHHAGRPSAGDDT